VGSLNLFSCKKYLISISDEAMFEPLFCFQNEVAIKSSIYVEECLKKRLLPFIHRHYPSFNHIFWPDFWVFLAQKVYEEGWYAKTEQQLVNCIKLQLKKLMQTFYSRSWEEFGRNFGL
jgi:hypothetical protein